MNDTTKKGEKQPISLVKKRVASIDWNEVSRKLTGRHLTKEHKLKIGKSNKGKVRSKEFREYLSKVQKGVPMSKSALKVCRAYHSNPEYRRKQSKLQKGKKLSTETKEKIKQSSLGRRHTKNTKIKMSIAQKKIRRSAKCKRIKMIYSLNIKEHKQAIIDEMKSFKAKGFKVFHADRARPDFIARKGNYVYAVEVEFGDPDTKKYIGQNLFDDIWWIIRKHKKH